MNLTRLASLLLLSASTLTACSDDGDGGGGGGGSDYLISLDADGTSYETATTGAISTSADGTFNFAAQFDANAGIGVSLTSPLAVGTHPTGADSDVFITFTAPDDVYRAGGASGDGELIVDSIEGDLVTGRFSGTANNIDLSGETLAIANGEFQVVITIKN